MSSISSTSTLAQCEAVYLDNAGYAEDNSTTKAQAFVTACRALLLKLPAKSAHGKGGSMEFNLDLIARQLQEAQAWLATSAAAGNATVTTPSFDGLRGY